MLSVFSLTRSLLLGTEFLFIFEFKEIEKHRQSVYSLMSQKAAKQCKNSIFAWTNVPRAFNHISRFSSVCGVWNLSWNDDILSPLYTTLWCIPNVNKQWQSVPNSGATKVDRRFVKQTCSTWMFPDTWMYSFDVNVLLGLLSLSANIVGFYAFYLNMDFIWIWTN